MGRPRLPTAGTAGIAVIIVDGWATAGERTFMSVIGLLDSLPGALPSAPLADGFILHTSPWRWAFGVLSIMCPPSLMGRMRIVTDRPEDTSRDLTVTTDARTLCALVRPGHLGFETRHAKVSA